MRRRLLAAAGAGYLLGVVPSAALAARAVSGGKIDLRSAGTGNPGGANAFRLLGRRAGVAVTCADIAKGALACRLGRALAGDAGAHVAGVAAVAGHCYPAPARFRGGMGVATSVGQCLATFPAYMPLDVAVAVAVGKLAPRRHRVALSLAVSSGLWVTAGAVWWRRRLPNLWGVAPSPLLPLANAATSGLIASRGLIAVRKRRRTEVAPAP
ncbi:MAG: glycerol-3-phosphate acyltransferase [Gaiellaceae bacterium]